MCGGELGSCTALASVDFYQTRVRGFSTGQRVCMRQKRHEFDWGVHERCGAKPARSRILFSCNSVIFFCQKETFVDKRVGTSPWEPVLCLLVR